MNIEFGTNWNYINIIPSIGFNFEAKTLYLEFGFWGLCIDFENIEVPQHSHLPEHLRCELEKDLNEAIRRNKIDVYTCQAHHDNVTLKEIEGVTPFMIGCKHKDCNELANSSNFVCNQNLKPTHEWYKPTDTSELNRFENIHVKNGGLLLRKIKQ